MKKLLSIVVIAAAFTLVGCSAEKPGASNAVTDTGFAQTKESCKGKKCHRHHHGKLGVEKAVDDMAK
jgi:uncharacterized protein YcfL